MRFLSAASLLLVLFALGVAPVHGQNQDIYLFDDTDGDGEQWRILSHKDNLQIDYSDTYDDVVRLHKDRSATFLGNLGVGAKDPSARFVVQKDESITRIGNVTTGCCGDDQIPQGDFRGLIAGWDTDYAFFGLRDYGDDNKDVVINNEQGSDDIRFQSAGRDLAIIEGGSGDVGIGTTSPNKKLSVAGNVLAEEVIVKPQSEWADHVFQGDYDLPTLEEVSAFIDRKGHLLGVPSAESVRKNGLHLGEMDATLLRKVEELTLYAIEQKKRADSLAVRLDSQVAKMSKAIGRLREETRSLRRRLNAEQRTREEEINTLQRQIAKLRERLSSQE